MDAFSSSDSDEEMTPEELFASMAPPSTGAYNKLGNKSEYIQSVLTAKTAGGKSQATALSKMSKISKVDIKLMERPDEPIKGMIFFIIYTFFSTLKSVLAKELYTINPDLSPFQMLVFQSAFGLII